MIFLHVNVRMGIVLTFKTVFVTVIAIAPTHILVAVRVTAPHLQAVSSVIAIRDTSRLMERIANLLAIHRQCVA